VILDSRYAPQPIGLIGEYMRALSVRQPYAELILRGIKPIEFGSTGSVI
jgi:hypothetical protein